MRVEIDSLFIDLSLLVAKLPNFKIILITCRIRLVGQKVLEENGLFDQVRLIGGGRVADKCIITSSIKDRLALHIMEM
jgi:predicted aconitase